jgi:hypothetical protein
MLELDEFKVKVINMKKFNYEPVIVPVDQSKFGVIIDYL